MSLQMQNEDLGRFFTQPGQKGPKSYPFDSWPRLHSSWPSCTLRQGFDGRACCDAAPLCWLAYLHGQSSLSAYILTNIHTNSQLDCLKGLTAFVACTIMEHSQKQIIEIFLWGQGKRRETLCIKNGITFWETIACGHSLVCELLPPPHQGCADLIHV